MEAASLHSLSHPPAPDGVGQVKVQVHRVQVLLQWRFLKIPYNEDFKKSPTISFSNITDQN